MVQMGEIRTKGKTETVCKRKILYNSASFVIYVILVKMVRKVLWGVQSSYILEMLQTH